MIKLQVRGSSSRLGRFNLTPIVEAEYMAATGFPTQNLRLVLASWLGPYMAERSEFELPVPLVFLSNRGFSGSFVFSVGTDRRPRRKRNGREAGYFRLNRRNRQFESISLIQSPDFASSRDI